MATTRNPLENLGHLVEINQLDIIKELVLAEIKKTPHPISESAVVDHAFVINAVRDAITKKQIETLKFFLEIGFDPTSFVQKTGSRFETSFLELAVETDELPLVQLVFDAFQKHMIERGPSYQKDLNKIQQHVFLIAVERGHLDIIEFLLMRGISANSVGVYSHLGGMVSVLTKSIYDGNVPLIELFIRYGASINAALGHAKDTFLGKGKDDKQFLKILLDFSMGTDFDSFACAILGSLIDVTGLNFLGVSINGEPITHKFLEEQKCLGADNALVTLDDLKKLPEDHRKEKLTHQLSTQMVKFGSYITAQGAINLVPIYKAAEVGDIAAVRARLEAKISPNEKEIIVKKEAGIVRAAENGHLEIVKIMAAHPAIDPSSINLAYEVAQKKSRHNVVTYLCHELKVNSLDDGESVLHRSIHKSDVALVKNLIEMKADVNLKNRNGFTPLQLAVSKKRAMCYDFQWEKCIEVLNLLLANGADPNQFNVEHYSPLEIAASNGNIDMVGILLPITRKEERIYKVYNSRNGEESIERLPWYTKVLDGLLLSLTYKENLAILKALKEHGARFDFINEFNETLLHLAINNFCADVDDAIEKDHITNFLNLISFLIENNVNPGSQDRKGQTSLDILKRYVNVEKIQSEPIQAVYILLSQKKQDLPHGPSEFKESVKFISMFNITPSRDVSSSSDESKAMVKTMKNC